MQANKYELFCSGCLPGRCSVSSLPWSPAFSGNLQSKPEHHQSTHSLQSPIPWDCNLTSDQHLIDLLNKLQSSRLGKSKCISGFY